jgi:hypothetical protein
MGISDACKILVQCTILPAVIKSEVIVCQHPRDRIVQHFGLGRYGEHLADEILEEYREMIATYLEDTGLGLAAQTVRAQEWEHDV